VAGLKIDTLVQVEGVAGRGLVGVQMAMLVRSMVVFEHLPPKMDVAHGQLLFYAFMRVLLLVVARFHCEMFLLLLPLEILTLLFGEMLLFKSRQQPGRGGARPTA